MSGQQEAVTGVRGNGDGSSLQRGVLEQGRDRCSFQSVKRMLTAAPIRVMPPEMMARDTERFARPMRRAMVDDGRTAPGGSPHYGRWLKSVRSDGLIGLQAPTGTGVLWGWGWMGGPRDSGYSTRLHFWFSGLRCGSVQNSEGRQSNVGDGRVDDVVMRPVTSSLRHRARGRLCAGAACPLSIALWWRRALGPSYVAL